MDDMVILMNEVKNSGKTVHLYLSPSFNQYVAYGYSAYIVYRIVRGVPTYYDEDMQMPMVRLEDKHLEMIGLNTTEHLRIKGEYLRLEAKVRIKEDDYTEWAGFLRETFYGII